MISISRCLTFLCTLVALTSSAWSQTEPAPTPANPTTAPAPGSDSSQVGGENRSEPASRATATLSYAEEVARLEAIPATQMPFRNSPLHAVIRTLALHADMNFIAPADADFGELVTLRFHGTPWQFLSLLKRRHGFEMTFEDGLWSFSRPRASELITRTYQLRYNNQVTVKAKAGATSGLSSSSTSGSSGSGGSSQATSTGRGAIFESNAEQIVKDIKALLGLPVSGREAAIAPAGVVGALAPLDSRAQPDVGATTEASAPKSDVIYLNDANSLFVIATRQQHQIVEEFLEAVDRPQPLIRIDARLVETNRNPQSFIGLDPSGIARPSFTLRDESSTGTTGTTGTSTTTGTSGSSSQSSLTTPAFNLGNLSTLQAPTAAVLSASDIGFQLNLLAQDSTSRVTNQPNLVTTNNREVSIESVIEEPYANSSTTNVNSGTVGTSGQTSTQLDRIKIGTVINVLPQIMRGEDGRRFVYLNLSMTVSGKLGDKDIYGQAVPITSSRSYAYSIAVPDGYTLAIGGLAETSLSDSETKIPLAGDIPVIGYLFKSKQKSDTRRNLIAYITPTILDTPGTLEAIRDLPTPKDR